MRNKIIFIVATQYDNVGDLLINKCLIDQLSLHGEVYIDSTNVPDHFKNLLLKGGNNVFELKSITNYNFKSLSFIRLLFSDFGFTHIFRSPGPLRNGGSVKVFIKNLVIGTIFSLFKRKGVSSFLVGNDIHYKANMDSLMVKYFSSNVAKILCRSGDNVEALKKLNVNQVGYIPDMCFGYRPIQDNNCTTKAIAVSFRDLEDVSYDNKIRSTIQSILESNQYDSMIFFYQVQRDYEYNKKLYMIFRKYENVVFKEECLDWSDLSFYNTLRFTLSNRLHVLLLGLVHGVTPIPLLNADSKTDKIIGIFKTIGLSDLLNENSDSLDFISILENDSKWNSLILDIKERQFEILQHEINSLFNLPQNK